MKMGKNTLAALPVFLLFFLFLILQFRYVWVYYDDYGYYALIYGSHLPHTGNTFTLAELFSFLKEHYTGANGRLLYTGLWLAIYLFAGLNGVRVAAAFIVTAIWTMLFALTVQKYQVSHVGAAVLACVLCMCYGLIGVMIHRSGTYWFAAFFVYYTPILPMEVFALLYDRWKDDLSWKQSLLLIPLVFASGWSGESWSLATVVSMCAITFLYLKKEKKFDPRRIVFILTALLGFGILLCSPGLQARSATRMIEGTRFDYYLSNVIDVFKMYFGVCNRLCAIFVPAGASILCFNLYLHKQKIWDLVCLAVAIIAWVFLLMDATAFSSLLSERKDVAILTIVALFCGFLLPSVRYYYYEGNFAKNLLLFTAFMDIASVAGIPDRPLRVLIPFLVVGFVIVVDAVVVLWSFQGDDLSFSMPENLRIFTQTIVLTVVIAYSCCLLFSSVSNTLHIFRGYRTNSSVNASNDAALKEAKSRIDSGEQITEVSLKHLPDDTYGCTMLYHESWFKLYIDAYYGIPAEVQYIYH